MGKVLEAGLRKLQEKHVCVGDVRGIGLFWLLELVKNRETKEPMNGFNKPATEPMAKVAGRVKEAAIPRQDKTGRKHRFVFAIRSDCDGML